VDSSQTADASYQYAENRITSIIKLASGTCETPVLFASKWDFTYDGDGTRTATLITPYNELGEPQSAQLTAYFFGGAYETQADGTIRKYYSLEGQTILRTLTTGSSTLSYFLTDHLGSVVAITDASGTGQKELARVLDTKTTSRVDARPLCIAQARARPEGVDAGRRRRGADQGS